MLKSLSIRVQFLVLSWVVPRSFYRFIFTLNCPNWSVSSLPFRVSCSFLTLFLSASPFFIAHIFPLTPGLPRGIRAEQFERRISQEKTKANNRAEFLGYECICNINKCFRNICSLWIRLISLLMSSYDVLNRERLAIRLQNNVINLEWSYKRDNFVIFFG